MNLPVPAPSFVTSPAPDITLLTVIPPVVVVPNVIPPVFTKPKLAAVNKAVPSLLTLDAVATVNMPDMVAAPVLLICLIAPGTPVIPFPLTVIFSLKLIFSRTI